jgi:cytochrome P450
MRQIIPSKFDSRDPAVLVDPYPVYTALRDSGRLSRGGAGQWVVSHYDDVVRLIRDRRLSHEYPPEYHEFSMGDGPALSFFQRIMLDRDAPQHTRLRKLIGGAFSPRLVQHLHGYVREQVDVLLAGTLERGRFDVVGELAFPLPVMVVCELIGIPAVDRAAVRPRAVDLAKAFALFVPPDERGSAHAAVAWLREYIGDLIEECRRTPGDDLLSNVLAAQRSDPQLSLDDVIDNVVFLFFAGFETTSNLIATSYAALLEHPAQLARLRADRSLVPSAVEEFLRYDAPIQATARLVREPLTIGDRVIKPGRVVVLLLGSANHDERKFHDPDGLDVGRSPNPHVSFGGGPHHCLGAALARVEGAATVSWLLDRASTFEPAGEIVRRPSATFRSYSRLPVSVR